jgi:hypothetical protein
MATGRWWDRVAQRAEREAARRRERDRRRLRNALVTATTLLVVAGAGAVVALAQAQAPGSLTAFASWVNPQAYTDGTAMAAEDIKQTTIRCSAVVIDGQRQACAISPRIVPGGTTSTAIDFTFASAKGGAVCFQAQTESVTGAVSDWSAEACKVVAGKKPMPPVLTVK